MNFFILFICLNFVLLNKESEAKILERKETTLIVVHHSDTPDGNAANFREYHMKKGWSDIGYHFVVLRNGIIEHGRPVNLVGAHALGRNKHSIGICLVGKKDFTAEQIESLKFLMKSLCMKYKITKIQRHHSRCPGPGLPLEKIAREILG